MKRFSGHSWNPTFKEAKRLQLEFKNKIIPLSDTGTINTIAGIDISFSKNSDIAFAAIIVFSFPEIAIIEKKIVKGKIIYPYVPGYLAFREGPLIEKLFHKINNKPDITLFDGHGVAHPRFCGIASHIGVFLNIPTIGCAKSKLIGKYQIPKNKKGATSNLIAHDGKIIGKVLCTREGCKPIFVSVGHKIDLKTAVKITLQTCIKYRIPEPIRQAHILCNRNITKPTTLGNGGG